VDVGLGRRPLGDIEMLLERGDNQRTSPPAPAEGLYFVAASYPPELFLGPETGVRQAEVSVSDA
jgi:tRNA U38,U39,U40 pseudouridine synthase TruA